MKIAKHVTSKHVTCDISQGLELPFTKKNLHVYYSNFYLLNTFNNLLFLHRVKNSKTPKFLRPLHHYPTSFSQNNYIVSSFKLAKSKYRITISTLKLRNSILNIEEKLIEKSAVFKATIKTVCVGRERYRIFLMHV